MISIAERIRRWRESRDHVTRADLAKSVGVSRQTIHHWEAGSTEPTHDNVAKIAEALDVPLPIFWGDPPKPSKTKAS